MNCVEIIELAKSHGFVTNHFLKMRDLKSGVICAGQFTKYKQFAAKGLRIKGPTFEVDVIVNGEPTFEILQAVEIKGIERECPTCKGTGSAKLKRAPGGNLPSLGKCAKCLGSGKITEIKQ